jgi:cell wall-associated NlpC family hydrolase
LIKRSLLALAVLVSAVAAPLGTAHASATSPAGRVATVVQNTFEHRLRVTGWAYDPARSGAAVTVKLFVDGNYVGSVRADDPSPVLDESLHISGGHRYVLVVARATWAKSVTGRTSGALAAAPMAAVGTRAVTHYFPPPGVRIISVAKRYVGTSPYVEGGASPRGFDCSGYTKYSYAQARVRTLTHNAEAQRRSMRRLARSNARPGDLVFYMSGGTAYHVAIYAGRGWQYAAATVKDGVRHQRVWSTNVQYRTDWH